MKLFKKIGRLLSGRKGIFKKIGRIFPKHVRAAGQVATAIIQGIKAVSPFPEHKAETLKNDVRNVVEITKTLQSTMHMGKLSDKEQFIEQSVNRIRDILDDGRINNSEDPLSQRAKSAISLTVQFLPLVAYVIYAIHTGDWNLHNIMHLLQ